MTVEDVRVDHRRPHVLMSQKLLHGANVVALIEQLRRERMPQGMARSPLLKPRSKPGLMKRSLDCARMEMVTMDCASRRLSNHSAP